MDRTFSHQLASTSGSGMYQIPAEPAVSMDILMKAIQKQGHRQPNTLEACHKLLAKLTHLHLDSLKLTHLDSLKQCPKLEVLYLYDNQLTNINSIGTNRLLIHLNLQSNQLQNLQGLETLGLLQKLYVQSNCIGHVSGLEACTRLQELHLSDQKMPAGASITFDPGSLSAIADSLTILSVAGCGIQDPRPLAVLRRLRSLDLARNNISNFGALESMLQGLAGLKTLDLRGNPICKEAKYRDNIILMAPDSLKVLDGEPIPEAHRAFLLHLHLQHMKSGLQNELELTSSSGGQAKGDGEPGQLSQASGNGDSAVKKHTMQPPLQRPTAAGGYRIAAARGKKPQLAKGNSIPSSGEAQGVCLSMDGTAVASRRF
eukprot:jgi/Chrzof1/13297/Cz07g28010.t1